jgi:dTDP-4-dehydrorhamnose 3,5-epimerase-like enzyme
MESERGAAQIKIDCHVDDRGFLYQIYKTYDFPEVKRIYVLGNFLKNTIRGLHRHEHEWKGYFVVVGAAKFVVVDPAKQITQYILSDKNPSILVVPPHHPHGWISLSDKTVLIGLSNRTLEESMKDDFREDPLTLGKQVWETKPR